MSCSKIFSGDLPEITYGIIKDFQNDYSTLHSCILVNRLWCRLAIPLLWENPFSIRTGTYNFIEVYLHNSNDEFKRKLYEYKIINNSLVPSNTLFNYPSFLKYLNTYKYIISIEKWFGATIRTSTHENVSCLIDICVPLFKIFIENQVNLHTLDIENKNIHFYNRYCDDIVELILQNLNFLHNIKNLNIYIKGSTDFLRILKVINLRQNIKKILLDENVLIYQSLLLSKDYSCLNTLNTIIFYNVDFRKIINLDKLFEQLNVLESVHLIYCILDIGLAQRINNLTKPFKLKSLFIGWISQIESLQLLLQKSGGYLENFVYEDFDDDESLQHELLELIIKYCKNINFFSFYEFGSVNYQIINLVENIKQNLNYLLINIEGVYYNDSDGNVEHASIILQKLGQMLSFKLEYLSLNLYIIERDFKAFLENSQNIFINKLIINQKGSDDILHYVKEYMMKEERVKYLAIRKDRRDLSDLKDEVKEFKLHNIRVRSYNDLSINAIDYIKNID